VVGPDHPQTGQAQHNLGEASNLLGRHADAEAAYRRALAIFLKAGNAPSVVAWPQTGLGGDLVDQGRPAEAVPLLEKALATRLETKAPAAQLGETRFNLARALWSRPEERRRATELAADARRDLKDAPKLLARLNAWEAKR
jgi:tetratricopeptide (TPR) repeat protein